MAPTFELRGCKSKEELREVVELCDAAFDKTTREYFERHMFKDTTLSPEDARILVKDGKIVSSVQVFPRTIYMGGKTVPMGGIGNVATLPSERKNGYAEKVMLDSMEYMERKGFRVSLLTTTINQYYEKFGFQTLKRRLVRINVTPASEPRAEVFDPGRDMDKAMRLYGRYNSESVGPLVRDAAYWRSQIDFCGEDGKLFLVWKEGEDVVAYVRGKKDTGSTKVLEYAFAEGDEKIALALFADLAFRTGQPKLEVFISDREKDRLASLRSGDAEVDTFFMAAAVGKGPGEQIKKELLAGNEFTFWLTDYF